MDNSNESITAKLCSYARANHCLCKQDKIFDDFLALKLMGNKEYKETEKIIENIKPDGEQIYMSYSFAEERIFRGQIMQIFECV